jgi:long-subunit fatty acid transport protein
MWYSVGMSHQMNKKLSIDTSLSLVVPDDTTINYTAPGSTDYHTRADVESDAFSAALSVNYRFK